MSNMSVSVTLRLQDQFTGPVRALLQQFQQLTRAAQDFNRAAGGAGSNTPYGLMQSLVRGLTGEVRNLIGQVNQLGRSMAAPTSGTFAQRQISDMQRLLGLQQQAISNNARMAAGPAGPAGPRVPGGPPSSGFWGRRGFNPNASLMDRAQYRGVNLAEQTLATGALDFDRARTQLEILGLPAEVRARAELAAREYSTIFRSLSPGHILETFREIVTQFQSAEEAFQLLPELLRIQDWQVLGGDSIERARDGMLRLVRAMGLSGRLIGPEGNLSLGESQAFLDAFLRARIHRRRRRHARPGLPDGQVLEGHSANAHARSAARGLYRDAGPAGPDLR
jgi:hypothetical protein